MRSPVELLFEGIGRGVSALAAAADPDLPDLLAESEGRRLALMVRGSGRILEIEVRDGALRVRPPRRITAGRPGSRGGTPEGRPDPAAEESRREGAPPVAGDEERRGMPGGDDGEIRGGADRAAPTGGEAGTRGPAAASDPGTDASSGARFDAPMQGGAGAQDPAAAPNSGVDAPAAAAIPAGADLELIGSVPDLLRFLHTIRREPLPDDPFAAIEVHGGPEARAGFVQLLRRIDPDYEALLARAVGGVVAHAVSRTTLGRLYQARESATWIVDEVTEYLEEETRLVPDPASRARFSQGVRALSDKVGELEERLDRAARRRD